jgi:hypothetical protein
LLPNPARRPSGRSVGQLDHGRAILALVGVSIASIVSRCLRLADVPLFGSLATQFDNLSFPFFLQLTATNLTGLIPNKRGLKEKGINTSNTIIKVLYFL